MMSMGVSGQGVSDLPFKNWKNTVKSGKSSSQYGSLLQLFKAFKVHTKMHKQQLASNGD